MIARMLGTTKEDMIYNENKYTDWELEFIQSIFSQFEKKGDLSSRQCEILERIHDK
jgi:hypothetical protein